VVMFERVMELDMANEALLAVYREVCKLAPHIVTGYLGGAPRRQGDTVQMVGGVTVCVDRVARARGSDRNEIVSKVMEQIKPHVTFMSGATHFFAQVLDLVVRGNPNDFGDEYAVTVIWGVK
jgi:hypothetical protein